MMYIITIDSSFIRDAQYADTNDLPASEMESIYMDSDLDYIDSVLGDPQVEPAEDWVENAVAQQIENPKIADKVYNNIREASEYKDLQDVKKESHVNRDKSAASLNRDAVRLDRMLYNISKDDFLADSEKVDMALRLLFD